MLSDCITNSFDTIVRYGGEEFSVILPDSDKEEVLILAQKMRCSVENINIRHAFSSASDHVTISLGVHTVIPSEGLSMNEFIRITDEALYKAKNNNRNQVSVI
ncbi:MAG: GGDEF domain-containing protein [Herbinix sp.]|nr:GGDEF domain-containing protein [Herbinix sp.]